VTEENRQGWDVGPVDYCAAGRSVFMREPDGTWPTKENPCTERGQTSFSIVTPGVGRYVFRQRLCGWHEMEFKEHFRVTGEEFTPEGKRYRVEARRVGDYWELTIHGHGITQCAHLSEAWVTAADYLSLQLEKHVPWQNVDVAIAGPDE
jgi:hypothetical protein